mgnify:CR=1 FL=1
MNLAAKDIRHNLARFALTTFGIGLLLMIVMGMAGIYRGLVAEAVLLVDKIGADLWLVQGSTRGPFAEISRVPANLEDRARAVPGVASARALTVVHFFLMMPRPPRPTLSADASRFRSDAARQKAKNRRIEFKLDQR